MLAYTDLNTGTSDTTIIFIHGLGSHRGAWKHQESLAAKYRLIMVDLRGHGETVLDHDLTIKNFAKDVIKLLKHLKIRSSYICGLSLGGIVAQEMYKQRPDLIAGMILANTTAYIPAIFAQLTTNATKKAFNNGTMIDVIVGRGLYDNKFENEAREAFYIRDSYLESARAAIGLDYIFYLPRIKVPVLLITSSHDKVTPQMGMEMMKYHIPNVKMEVFNRTGHLSNIEQKDKFNNCVDIFINQL